MIAPDSNIPDARAIGVFDSGVGGLTVLHECLVNLPHEDFIYLGDTGNFPYGSKSLAEVRRLAFSAVGFLAAKDVKLIVVACNSAAAAALSQLQTAFATPIVGVVMPGARAAVQATRDRRVGIMATEATVRSNAYQHALHTLDAGLEVFPVACPRLAPLIQNGDVFSEETEQAARGCVAPLKEAERGHGDPGLHPLPPDNSYAAPASWPQVALIDSAEETAREVREILERKAIGNDPGREGDYRFFATGDSEEFREVGMRFLQLPIREVTQI